jgi:uncharacterized protein (DUF2249 family)
MTTTSDQAPILASWKISEVLRRHPETLDVLIETSPAFAKLRNPVMRKVQSRLVTVAQAAGIAGIEPAALTRRLNQAAGITAADDEAAAPVATVVAAKPEWVETAPIAAELDVRPMLERGEEPFKAIMAAARQVPIGQVLQLIAGFEPLPLYDALAKQGFSRWTEHDGGRWEVRFHREPIEAEAPPAKTTGLDWDAAAAEVTIDVSELTPPEPMIKILQTLETLPSNARLLVHHVRRPMHLYDRLDEMGYPHETRELRPGQVEVLIEKRAS